MAWLNQWSKSVHLPAWGSTREMFTDTQPGSAREEEELFPLILPPPLGFLFWHLLQPKEGWEFGRVKGSRCTSSPLCFTSLPRLLPCPGRLPRRVCNFLSQCWCARGWEPWSFPGDGWCPGRLGHMRSGIQSQNLTKPCRPQPDMPVW